MKSTWLGGQNPDFSSSWYLLTRRVAKGLPLCKSTSSPDLQSPFAENAHDWHPVWSGRLWKSDELAYVTVFCNWKAPGRSEKLWLRGHAREPEGYRITEKEEILVPVMGKASGGSLALAVFKEWAQTQVEHNDPWVYLCLIKKRN